MRKLLGLSILAITYSSIPAAQAGSISYSASVGCNDTCVTAFVEWSNFNPGVSFVVVLDNLGDFLFSLNTDPFPESTGQIDPNPQTVTGLSPQEINLISGGGVIAGALQSLGFEGSGWPPPTPTSADLAVEDCNHNILAEVTFTATSSTAPEPATWALMVLSLGLFATWNVAHGRKLRIVPVDRHERRAKL
jgi:hypothetical protein